MTWFEKLAESRPANHVIGGSDPYMLRWWVIPRNRFFNIYLHHFLRSDYDDALHDHPWINFSYLLKGSYIEHTIARGGVHSKKQFVQGDWKFRLATYAHRIEIDNPCWSLFITGPVMRKWGFHCPQGWRYWKTFMVNKDQGVGGCE